MWADVSSNGIKLNILKKPKINSQITATEVRLVDEEGNNLGLFEITKALELSKEKELDLIEISPMAKPPVAKIMDYGKYIYIEKKKLKEVGKSAPASELKVVRIGLGTSENDLMIKAKQASEFLEEGNKVKIDMFLRGREKYLDFNFLKERLMRILKLVVANHKISENVKKGPRGIYILIERTK